jgi:formylmethanofuran dehydrogenase subunit B
VTAGAVCTWISGYPLRVSYATGAPDYDPYRWSIGRMLQDKEGDLLVWIASISPDLVPPKTDLPTIVLGTPGLKLAKEPDVFIPVGTPGVDHAGRLVRVDNVVSLPLKDLGRADLPIAADVLASIEAAL